MSFAKDPFSTVQDEVEIVIFGIQLMRAEVHDLVP
jgi:hypothetical protein